MEPITAYVFPGQGAQYVGMGRDLCGAFPIVKKTFEQADDLLGFALSDLCFRGPEEALRDTMNQQPALLTLSVAVLRLFCEAMPGSRLAPSFLAGHSLGEYSALVAAGALDFASALCLVRERGRLMKETGLQTPGGMAAVLGLDEAELSTICQEASDQTRGLGVVPANFNSPGQIVISGESEALQLALELARSRGAKRVIPLAVSIASHSPLMREAALKLREAIEATPFDAARVPVVSNVTAWPVTDAREIKDLLVRQLYSPVRWTESIQRMVSQGVTHFIEMGPGQVLAGLIKRIAPQVSVVSLGDTGSWRQWMVDLTSA
ncbi:MAG: ACP S-malonyltransferase [Chloroflexota bacterium]